MNKTIEHGDVKITVRSSTGYDTLYANVIWQKLDDALPPALHWLESGYRRRFGQVCTQSEILKGIDWKPATAADTPETIAASFDVWMRLDGALLSAWAEALESVDQPPGKHELLPPEYLNEAELNDPLS